jgi:hypothetical protein
MTYAESVFLDRLEQRRLQQTQNWWCDAAKFEGRIILQGNTAMIPKLCLKDCQDAPEHEYYDDR